MKTASFLCFLVLSINCCGQDGVKDYLKDTTISESVLKKFPTADFHEDLARLYSNGKWGYINNRGDLVIATKYDSCDVFKHGFARVRTGSKWGIIDRTGTQILESKYEGIFPGENGIFIFYENGVWGVIDKTGKILAPPTFTSITSFENDRALARMGKTFTIIKSPLAK